MCGIEPLRVRSCLLSLGLRKRKKSRFWYTKTRKKSRFRYTKTRKKSRSRCLYELFSIFLQYDNLLYVWLYKALLSCCYGCLIYWMPVYYMLFALSYYLVARKCFLDPNYATNGSGWDDAKRISGKIPNNSQGYSNWKSGDPPPHTKNTFWP